MSELEKQLLVCLMELLYQVDEDCPQEYRTKHLKDAMQDAHDLILEEQLKMGRLAT